MGPERPVVKEVDYDHSITRGDRRDLTASDLDRIAAPASVAIHCLVPWLNRQPDTVLLVQADRRPQPQMALTVGELTELLVQEAEKYGFDPPRGQHALYEGMTLESRQYEFELDSGPEPQVLELVFRCRSNSERPSWHQI